MHQAVLIILKDFLSNDKLFTSRRRIVTVLSRYDIDNDEKKLIRLFLPIKNCLKVFVDTCWISYSCSASFIRLSSESREQRRKRGKVLHCVPQRR